MFHKKQRQVISAADLSRDVVPPAALPRLQPLTWVFPTFSCCCEHVWPGQSPTLSSEKQMSMWAYGKIQQKKVRASSRVHDVSNTWHTTRWKNKTKYEYFRMIKRSRTRRGRRRRCQVEKTARVWWHRLCTWKHIISTVEFKCPATLREKVRTQFSGHFHVCEFMSEKGRKWPFHLRQQQHFSPWSLGSSLLLPQLHDS